MSEVASVKIDNNTYNYFTGLIATVISNSVLKLLVLIFGVCFVNHSHKMEYEFQGIAAKYDGLILGIYLPLIIVIDTGSSFWYIS